MPKSISTSFLEALKEGSYFEQTTETLVEKYSKTISKPSNALLGRTFSRDQDPPVKRALRILSKKVSEKSLRQVSSCQYHLPKNAGREIVKLYKKFLSETKNPEWLKDINQEPPEIEDNTLSLSSDDDSSFDALPAEKPHETLEESLDKIDTEKIQEFFSGMGGSNEDLSTAEEHLRRIEITVWIAPGKRLEAFKGSFEKYIPNAQRIEEARDCLFECYKSCKNSATKHKIIPVLLDIIGSDPIEDPDDNTRGCASSKLKELMDSIQNDLKANFNNYDVEGQRDLMRLFTATVINYLLYQAAGFFNADHSAPQESDNDNKQEENPNYDTSNNHIEQIKAMMDTVSNMNKKGSDDPEIDFSVQCILGAIQEIKTDDGTKRFLKHLFNIFRSCWAITGKIYEAATDPSILSSPENVLDPIKTEVENIGNNINSLQTRKKWFLQYFSFLQQFQHAIFSKDLFYNLRQKLQNLPFNRKNKDDEYLRRGIIKLWEKFILRTSSNLNRSEVMTLEDPPLQQRRYEAHSPRPNTAASRYQSFQHVQTSSFIRGNVLSTEAAPLPPLSPQRPSTACSRLNTFQHVRSPLVFSPPHHMPVYRSTSLPQSHHIETRSSSYQYTQDSPSHVPSDVSSLKCKDNFMKEEGLKNLIQELTRGNDSMAHDVVESLIRIMNKADLLTSNTARMILLLLRDANMERFKCVQSMLENAHIVEKSSQPNKIAQYDVFLNVLKFFIGEIASVKDFNSVHSSLAMLVVASSDKDIVPRLLKTLDLYFEDAKLCDLYGRTIYHHIARNGPSFMFDNISKNLKGLDINKREHMNKRTALHKAAVSDKGLLQTEKLLSLQADPNIQDRQGDTPLYLCIKLIKEGASSPEKKALMPILMKKVEVLLGCSANPLLENYDKKTALDIALESDNVELISKLKQKVPEETMIYRLNLIVNRCIENPEQQKPPLLSMKTLVCDYLKSEKEISNMILWNIAGLCANLPKDDAIALEIKQSLRESRYNAVFTRLLICRCNYLTKKTGNDPQAAISNKLENLTQINLEFNNFPISLAAMHCTSEQQIKEILEITEDFNHKNDLQLTPIHLAVLCHNTTALQIIASHENVNLNIQTFDGYTPLHLAAYLGYSEGIEILLKNGADSSIRNIHGETPFLTACHNIISRKPVIYDLPISENNFFPAPERLFSLETLQAFLNNCQGDLFSDRDKSGHNALHLAMQSNNPEIVSFLCWNSPILAWETNCRRYFPIEETDNIENIKIFTQWLYPDSLKLEHKIEVVKRESPPESLTYLNKILDHLTKLDELKTNLEEGKIKTTIGLEREIEILDIKKEEASQNLRTALEILLKDRLLNQHNSAYFSTNKKKSLPKVLAKINAVETFKRLTEANPNLLFHKTDSSMQYTPLDIAAKYGHIAFIDLYDPVTLGAAFNPTKNTPGHVAAFHGHTDFIHKLLNKGIDYRQRNRDGMTMLHCSAEEEHEKNILFLKSWDYQVRRSSKNAPRRSLCQAEAADGGVALHAACQHNNDDKFSKYYHMNIVKALLENEPQSLHKTNNQGRTPLHIACLSGLYNVVEYLVKDKNADLEARDRNGFTPVMLAALGGHNDILKLLLDCNATAEITADGGETMAHILSRSNNIEGLKILIKNTGSEILLFEDDQEESPLHEISKGDNIKNGKKIISLYLKYQPPEKYFERLNTSGQHFLHQISLQGNRELLSFTIEKLKEIVKKNHLYWHNWRIRSTLGVDSKEKIDKVKNNSSLHNACSIGDLGTVRLLVEIGAQLDIKNAKKRRPIHEAIINQHWDIVNYLLDQQFNHKRTIGLSEQDSEGKNAIHHLFETGIFNTASRKILKRLLLFRKKIGTPLLLQRDNQDKTILHTLSQNYPSDTPETPKALNITMLALLERSKSEQQAFIGAKDSNGFKSTEKNILIESEDNNSPESTKNKKINPKIIRTTNKWKKILCHNNTPLHYFCIEGLTNKIERCITNRWKLDVKNDKNHAPLHEAIIHKQWDAVRRLLKAKRENRTPIGLSKQNSNGKNALHHLLKSGDAPEDILREMLTLNSEIVLQHNNKEKTVLEYWSRYYMGTNKAEILGILMNIIQNKSEKERRKFKKIPETSDPSLNNKIASYNILLSPKLELPAQRIMSTH